jgi:beta-galactosidase GanA
MIMPLVPIVFRPTKERLKEWVKEGGCLLIGPLTGHRTEEFTAWTDEEFGGLEELMGATFAGSFEAEGSQIVWGTDPTEGAAATEGMELPVSSPRGQCHAFTATTAHVLARYQRDSARGDAAILMNKLGEGTVITLGARVDRESYLDLVHTLCELAKIEAIASGSEAVAVVPRMNPDGSVAAYGVVNLSGEGKKVVLPHGGRDRLGNREVGTEILLVAHEVMLVEVGGSESVVNESA